MGFGEGEVAGGESTSAMAGASPEWCCSDMRVVVTKAEQGPWVRSRTVQYSRGQWGQTRPDQTRVRVADWAAAGRATLVRWPGCRFWRVA